MYCFNTPLQQWVPTTIIQKDIEYISIYIVKTSLGNCTFSSMVLYKLLLKKKNFNRTEKNNGLLVEKLQHVYLVKPSRTF